MELGDFSFFSQAYEAMRVSVTEFHQFPWFNPWVSGGVPLYGNPQMGLFSVQMLFVFIFGAPFGLKMALVFYTFAGYTSMNLLLRKYFKIGTLLAVLLSLIWVFSSFFVAHLPAHFTFVWYMLAPLYIYLALTVRGWKDGLLFGGAFAIMALSQIHNAFMHLLLICGIILVVRLAVQRASRRALLIAMAAAAAVFIVVAGHRFLFTYENVSDFPREVADVVPHPLSALLGVLLPLSHARPLQFLNYPQHPFVPHGFHEATATIGIFALTAALFACIFIAYNLYTARSKWRTTLLQYRLPLTVLAVALFCFVMALGAFLPIAPYSILKHLPVFGEMRVSTRWFIFFDLALIAFIGLMIQKAPKKSFFKFTGYSLLILGVVELMALNVGYQSNVLAHEPANAPKKIGAYTFEQTSYYGEVKKLPDGEVLRDDGNMPAPYREYDAMQYNMGILYANDALVQLALDPRRSPGHPTCPWEEGCSFVRTANAKVKSWSPNKIVLERTAPGDIRLNMNNSNYFVINGKRNGGIKVAEPFTDFTITNTDKTITILVKPSVITAVKDLK